MRKYVGKITLSILSICLIVLMLYVTYGAIQSAKADTGTSKTLAIHKAMGNGFTSVGDAYAIITDLSNADMMHASTGVADATYGNCDIEFTADGQNTDWALATAPALDLDKKYAITIYENAAPAAGDTAVIGPLLYDPATGKTFSDSNPLEDNRVRTKFSL